MNTQDWPDATEAEVLSMRAKHNEWILLGYENHLWVDLIKQAIKERKIPREWRGAGVLR